MTALKDHLNRVYAGVVGKAIGVYLGRPVEGWPREQILADIGQVRYYIHHLNDQPLFDSGVRPLVVTDDDVSATFVFVRALEEHGARELTSEEIGKTWLNNTVEDRSIIWWGGKGISTEHTAYLNLKHGIPGGLSGAIETNGKTVAEQIGGEIFVDGFALCAAGNAGLAARLAKSAASVSHDGESVYGAISWAVMEAEAFLSSDVDHLLDTGLSYIPKDSVIARSTADIRAWAKQDGDWEKTRARIEANYGTDKYGGLCHVVPNHAIKVLSLVYGGHSFDEALHIIVTCGWDTDSNGGNVGCLLGVMHGLKGIDSGLNWREPLADRLLISSADGGYSINTCTRVAYDLTNVGRQLAGQPPLESPKNGAQFHFSLPGGVQGFQTPLNTLLPRLAIVEQSEGPDGPALAIRLRGFSIGNDPVEVLTDTFMPEECLKQSHYDMQASPLVYPGQKVTVSLRADDKLPFDDTLKATLTFQTLAKTPLPAEATAISCLLRQGDNTILEGIIPDCFDHWPVQRIGLTLTTTSNKPINTTVWVDKFSWTGSPKTSFARPTNCAAWPGADAEPWRRAFVNSATTFPFYVPNFTVTQSQGEGGIFQGTRDWLDYKITASNFVNHVVGANGIIARMQGLNRWYGLLFKPGKVAFVKALDDKRVELASTAFDWHLDDAYDVTIKATGKELKGYIDGNLVVEAHDEGFASGGFGMLVTAASATVDKFRVEPVSS